MSHLQHTLVFTRPAPHGQTAAIDPVAQIRAGLGWLALLEVLVGRERARDVLLQELAAQ